MIINRIGAQFTYEGVTYTIGDKIFSNDTSDFRGLFGYIKEIRTGDDRETDNDTPDFHCYFYPPFEPKAIAELESRFSDLYRSPKKVEDIALDEVIMAPDMIQVVTSANSTHMITAFRVEESWVIKGEPGMEVAPALDEVQAKQRMAELIHNESTEGCILEWCDDPQFEVEITPTFYECWLRDEYCENRYQVKITPIHICVSDELFESIGRRYVDGILRKHFAEQIECWEELEGLTDTQITEMIAAANVPERIKKQLNENGYLIESYWESVSEASFDLVKKYRVSQGLPAESNN
ncbi:MAG: hypothetical protein IKA47_00175 [Oscillospiraceae bacterium]|nr:hypothetical protein [Oscillospiraceae bacterium]